MIFPNMLAALLNLSPPLTYSKDDIFEEPSDVEETTYIHGTMSIHRVVRKKNAQRITYLEFYRLSLDEKPLFTQYYRKSNDPIVCGHKSFEGGSICCPHCLNEYCDGEKWLECAVCKQWYCSEDCFSA